MDLDARAFRCFIAVAETGSFHAAAARMCVSQPALSARIKELERRLGFALFDRTSRKVTITSEGYLFLPNARRLVAETEIALRAAHDIRTNQLRVATPDYTALIPERRRLFERFVALQGSSGLRVINDTHIHCLAALRHGDVDLAIVLLPDGHDAPPLPTGMEAVTVSRREASLLVPPGHPLARCSSAGPALLAGMRVLRLGRIHGRDLADRASEWLEELGIKPVRPPEASALALELAAADGQPALSLGWWPWLGGDCDTSPRRIAIDHAPFFSRIALVRRIGHQREAAEILWALAAHGAS